MFLLKSWRFAQLVEYLPSSHETLGLVPALQQLAEVVDIYHSSTLEVEVGDSEVQAHLPLHKELEASLGYMKTEKEIFTSIVCRKHPLGYLYKLSL